MATDVKFSITAKNKTEKTFKAIRSSLGSLSKAALGVGGALAGIAGVGALGAMAKSAMDTGDKIHKLNIRLGASVEALSQYRHVADMSGVSFETLTMGWQRMTRRISEAAQGTGAASKSLKELGLDAAQLASLAPEQQFEILADAIMKVEDPADRVRLAMQLFGSEGVKLLQTMQGGAAGLQAMREEADQLGMTMDQDMVNNMAAANDAIAKVGSQITSIVESLAGSMSPAIVEVAEKLQKWITANDVIIAQGLETTIESITTTLEYLKPVAIGTAKVFEVVGKAIGWVAFQVGRAVTAITDFYDSMTGGKDVAGTLSRWASEGWENLNQVIGTPGYETAGNGATVVNNFNSQISRSDAVAIASETARQTSRQ